MTNLEFIHSATPAQLADLFIRDDFYWRVRDNCNGFEPDKQDWIEWTSEEYEEPHI